MVDNLAEKVDECPLSTVCVQLGQRNRLLYQSSGVSTIQGLLKVVVKSFGGG